MKRAFSRLVLLALVTAATGCAFGPAASGTTRESATPHYEVPKESQDYARKRELETYAQVDEQADEAHAQNEKAALKAIKVVLGKEAAFPGWAVPPSASKSVKALRASKTKVQIEAEADGDGNVRNDDLLELKADPKLAARTNDLAWQVRTLSQQLMFTNMGVQNASLEMMFRASHLVRSRRQLEMDLNADDYAMIRHGLERLKRQEAMASATLALMATMQAVVNGNGDPKAIDTVGEATLAAFPIKVQVTEEDAKQYVKGLGANVQKVKARYEAGLRKVHGDKKYERFFKPGVDAMFAAAAAAETAKTPNQIIAETQARYREDVLKCKRGEDPGDDSMVGNCKAIRRAAQTGDTSDLPPGALKAFQETGGTKGAPAAANAGAKAAAAVGGVDAAMRGDVDGVLDSATKLFPGDGTIGASLQGIAALKKGDAKGAINAALSFVPVPGLKDAFGVASKLLFKS